MTDRLRRLLVSCAIAGMMSGSAYAGNVFLTGHDIDLHDGADGYDTVILDFLRGAGTAGAIDRASYDIGLIRSIDATNPSDFGFVGGVLDGTPPLFGSVTERDPTQFADGAAFAAFLSTIDVLVIASNVDCGGCDFSDGDSAVLNSFAGQIATAFNSDLDIWGNTSADLDTYYDFLPPSAAASGPPISGSSGFVPTAEGLAIGITDVMVNGDETHNRFVDIAPAFTVFETRPNTGLPGGNEIISIGLRDGRIVDDIIVDDSGDDGDDDGGDDGGDDGTDIAEPLSLSLLGIGALGIALMRRRKR